MVNIYNNNCKRNLLDQYSDICVAVKGKGLMVGLEFKEPPKALVKQCQENGLLVITAGKSTLSLYQP